MANLQFNSTNFQILATPATLLTSQEILFIFTLSLGVT